MSIHDRSIAIDKRAQHSADEPAKVWESWDEDQWVLFCRLNTKAMGERLRAAREESSYSVREWAQGVI